MHKSLVASLFLSGTLLFAAAGYAQNSSFAPHRSQTFAGSAAQPLASVSQSGLASQIASFLAQRGVFVPANSIVVASSSRSTNGQLIYRLTQQVGGLQVYGVSAKAAVTTGGDLVFLTQNFAAVAGTPQGTAGNEEQALRAALNGLYPGQNIAVGAARREANSVVFEKTPFFFAAPRVSHVLFQEEDGSLNRGLLVETWSNTGNLLHESLVGGGGNVLDVVPRTASDSYNVFTEYPVKTPQAIVAGPGTWLDATGQTTINIHGNNVAAYLDTDANNAPDSGGTGVSNGDFLATADLSASPSTTGNKAVAVQNLFYLNNKMHDILLAAGFTEAQGNFQTTNFTGSGLANDAVQAEAQDGSGTDNANFSTPNDGSKPRMQMYLWSAALPAEEVVVGNNSPWGLRQSGFGAALTLSGVGGPLVSVPTPSTLDAACTALPAGSLTGKVAIIERGVCAFTVKVLNAQNAGAKAVIIQNNTGTNESFAPGGTDRKVKIPSGMVGKADGATLRGFAGQSATLKKKASAPPQLDGDVDSDIVYHEYGHGLTWRMIGSMSGVLAGAIGEGASDVNAFLINNDPIVGEYAFANPAGIRRSSYEGYPYTYSYVGSGTGSYEVHNDGEIYAAAMWKFVQDARTAGKTTPEIQKIFVGGMDYTPATPAFENMRDGMLAYLAAPGAVALDKCIVWRAFAKFGVGYGAKGTVSPRGTVSITQSFALGDGCAP